MPLAYAVDLRWRIVWTYLAHHTSMKDIAELFQVCEESVWRYVTLSLQTGQVEARKQRHGPPTLLGEYERLVILQIILENPGIYLNEVRDKLLDKFGVPFAVSTICKTLKSMGCSRQVMCRVAKQRSDVLRASYMAKVSAYDYDGYSVRGLPVTDHRLLVRGVRYSAIPIVSLEGIHDVYITEHTMNGEIFVDFFQHCVLPIAQPFNGVNSRSVIVMDNASIHHVEEVANLTEMHGARLCFLPPYSPDLMPCEGIFSQVKSIIKENHTLFDICSCPRSMLALAFGMVTIEDCYGHISHCGYV